MPESTIVRRMRVVGVCAGATVAAVAIGLRTVDQLPALPSLLLLAAVVVSGWYGGLWPALVVSAVSAIALDFFFETPRFMLEVTDLATVLNVAAFLVVAVPLGVLNARLRRARDASEAARLAAERALHLREDLLAAVAHDLRTPVTAIGATLAALIDANERGDHAVVDRLLANAVHDADHLARLIADVLDLKRLEAGVAPRREWTAVGEVAASVLDRCAPLLGDRAVRFDVPDTLPLAQLDPTLLERVLTSLIENVAVQTPAGAPFAVEACADGVGLRIAVSDAGPGIPASARERVFATYERLDPARPGLGLGLALARSAVEAQGGRIWVEESDAGGSRFVIVLPDVLPTRRTT